MACRSRTSATRLPNGVACFILAGTLLFAAARRALQSTAAGVCTVALFALNPNLLYLQSAPMTEPVFFMALCGVLYGSLGIFDLVALGPQGARFVLFPGLPYASKEVWVFIDRQREPVVEV